MITVKDLLDDKYEFVHRGTSIEDYNEPAFLNDSGLEAGQVYKNYQTLAEFLGEPVYKGGTNRQQQLTRWRKYFSFERRGHKFVVTSVFSKSEVYQTYIQDRNEKAIKEIMQSKWTSLIGSIVLLALKVQEPVMSFTKVPVHHLFISSYDAGMICGLNTPEFQHSVKQYHRDALESEGEKDYGKEILYFSKTHIQSQVFTRAIDLLAKQGLLQCVKGYYINKGQKWFLPTKEEYLDIFAIEKRVMARMMAANKKQLHEEHRIEQFYALLQKAFGEYHPEWKGVTYGYSLGMVYDSLVRKFLETVAQEINVILDTIEGRDEIRQTKTVELNTLFLLALRRKLETEVKNQKLFPEELDSGYEAAYRLLKIKKTPYIETELQRMNGGQEFDRFLQSVFEWDIIKRSESQEEATRGECDG